MTTIIIPTSDGPAVISVDTLLLTKPTKRYPPGRIWHVLDEMRVAAQQDRVQGGQGE